MKPDRRMEFFLPTVLSSTEDRPLPTIARRGGKETEGQRDVIPITKILDIKCSPIHDVVSLPRESPVEFVDTVAFKLNMNLPLQQ